MSKVEFWFEHKHLLTQQNRYDSIQDALIGAGFNYPYTDTEPQSIMVDEVDLDSIKGDNFREFSKKMKLFIKKLNNKLPDGIKPIFETAKLDKGFMFKEQNDRVEYYPMVVEFDDGQQLIGLARQYGKEQEQTHINMNKPIKVTRWYLNGNDINPAIFKDKKTLTDENKQAVNIATLVEKNHPVFVKKYPNLQYNDDTEIQAEIDKLRAENETLKGQIEEAKKQENATQSQEPGNIADYPTMSDDDLEEWQDELEKIFLKRGKQIKKEIGDIGEYSRTKLSKRGKIIGVIIFGVKDNLEPIDEYIAKIKASDEYQEYIESKENKNKKSEPDKSNKRIEETISFIKENYKENADEILVNINFNDDGLPNFSANYNKLKTDYVDFLYSSTDEKPYEVSELREPKDGLMGRVKVKTFKSFKNALKDFFNRTIGKIENVKKQETEAKPIIVMLPTDEYNKEIKEAIANDTELSSLDITLADRNGNEFDSISKKEIKVKGATPKVANKIKKLIVSVADIEDEKYTAELRKFEQMTEDKFYEDTEKIQAMTDDEFEAYGDYLTDENYHSEKLVYRAIRSGEDDNIELAKKLLAMHDKEGGINSEIEEGRKILFYKMDTDANKDEKWKALWGEETFNKIKELATNSSKPEITAENIAEFYPTMSDEDKIKYSQMLGEKFADRHSEIMNKLNLEAGWGAENIKTKFIDDGLSAIESFVFGIKDNLEPIDEYIAKIKASPEYQEYIESKENENKKSDSELLDEIKNNATYKQILKDSFGGVMYNIGNADNYNMKDIEALKSLWKQIKNKGVADGIVKGAMGFIEDEVTKSEAYQKYIASKGSEDNQDIKQQARKIPKKNIKSKVVKKEKVKEKQQKIDKKLVEKQKVSEDKPREIPKRKRTLKSVKDNSKVSQQTFKFDNIEKKFFKGSKKEQELILDDLMASNSEKSKVLVDKLLRTIKKMEK